MEKLRFDNGYELIPLPLGVLEYGTILELKCELDGTIGDVEENLSQAVEGNLTLLSGYEEVNAEYEGYHEITSLSKEKSEDKYILHVVLRKTGMSDKEIIAELLEELKSIKLAE